MALLAMPIIVTNMGCDMLFIIRQRLHAQETPLIRRFAVLRDISLKLLSNETIEPFFQPRQPPAVEELYSIFSHLARCSVMRLSALRCDFLQELQCAHIFQ
jgi:Organic solute transport protein 1